MKNRILRVLQILFWLLFLAGIVWNALYLHHVLDDGKYYAHLTFLIMLLLKVIGFMMMFCIVFSADL